jgi:4-amino-4-deoxy-L-arabinose transferase-like glycosyltransferase
VGLWVAVALAALAKGPVALVAVAYALLAGKALAGRWSAANRTAWFWGVPGALAVVAAWAVPAYLHEPVFVRDILLGREIELHAVPALSHLGGAWRVLQYSILPFLPWSLLGLVAVARVPARAWIGHPLAGAVLWIVILAASFALLPTKRGDRFAPMFPALAVLAAWVVMTWPTRVRSTAWVPALTLIVAGALGVYRFRFAEESRNHMGEHVKAFAAAVHQKAGPDRIAFTGVGWTPLATLLARHQEGDATPTQLRAARWHIRPLSEGDRPVLVSDPIDAVTTDQGQGPARLGLFLNDEAEAPAPMSAPAD